MNDRPEAIRLVDHLDDVTTNTNQEVVLTGGSSVEGREGVLTDDSSVDSQEVVLTDDSSVDSGGGSRKNFQESGPT